MSCPVNFQALPSGVFDTVFTPENVRGRSSMNSFTPLSFPKSRSALWDGSPAGEKLRLQLCAHRRPRLVLLEKALRLAQRHARRSNKPHLLCFLLGSVCVDADEEGVTVTLDRFDPGRDQAGASGRFPSALLPGDVLVPCLFSSESGSEAVVQSEAELHQCFKELQQCVSGRHILDLSQLLKVRVQVVCSQQSDAAAFSLSWSAVCPSISVDVDPVRAVPIIPTALLRSLTSVSRPSLPATNQQRGFLTMDQTRKLLLLLESDPKASNLPLVGLWLSGVTHVYSPQVWAWCLRFLYSSTLQDRVLSESRCFLLVLFGSTHRAPQFFQCRGPEPGLQLDYQLLTTSQCVTLFQQVVSVEGRTLQCELGSEDHSRQTELFREAQTSFSRAAAGLSASDQDSGVEDVDLSPRPSPSPHPPAQQGRRVQPSVPELSLLIDSSFSSNHNARQGTAHKPPPADGKSAPPPRPAAPPPRPAAPPHIHSTPNSNLQQPCTCCSTHTCTSIFSSPGPPPAAPPPPSHHHPPPFINHSPHTSSPPPSAPRGDSSPPRFSHLTCVNQCCDQVGGVIPSDTYQLLLHQDRQLRLLQAQVQMLLEAQGKLQSSSQQVDTQTQRSTASIAVGTGASLFWGHPESSPLPHQEVPDPPASSCRPPSPGDPSVIWPVGGAENSDITGQEAGQHSVSGLQSPVLGESVSMYRPADEQQSFYRNLMSQLTSRLQESDSKQEVEEEVESRRRQSCGDAVVSATVRQLQQLGVDVDQEALSESDRRIHQTVESSSTLASINPAAVVSRLSVAEPTASSLFPGGSVDLSLEANAIALRYLSDSQLSRLSLGGHAPRPSPASCSNNSLLSPSNMSLATRKYMRRYGLIEEEVGENEEKEEVSVCRPLTNALNVKLLPPIQLIPDLQPKPNAADKENCSSRRPSLERASSRHTEGSVGNILDLSRLRQLPKLF